MDDQLDNDLKNRIKEVFDNFEDASASEGWLQLREKFPEKQAKRRAIAWVWWGAAAILFLFLGIGLWIYSANNNAEKYSVKIQKNPQPENLAGNKNQKDTTVKTITPNTAIPAKVATGSIAASGTNKVKILNPQVNKTPVSITHSITNNAAQQKTYTANTAHVTVKTVAKTHIEQLARVISSKNADSAKKAADKLQSQHLAITMMAKAADSIKKANQQQIAATTLANSSTADQPKGPVAGKPKTTVKSIASMLAETQDVKDKIIDKKSKTVNFGVYAATYFNYAKGSDNEANIGAGITSDIKITKNLKLVTGLTIAQNSMNFTGGVPTATAQSNLSFAPPRNAGGSLLLASAYNVHSAVTNAAVPAFKNYDADLVGLDIPVNLKYEFNPAKTNVYVLAGFSSGTFINETYTYQYNYPALFSPSLQQLQAETSRKSFNGFYLAKTLNLAFGVGYPVGKNRLILEPFLKYPLDGLGSQDIRFGAGGVNLKFSFQSNK
jgi:hypothetical protein